MRNNKKIAMCFYEKLYNLVAQVIDNVFVFMYKK